MHLQTAFAQIPPSVLFSDQVYEQAKVSPRLAPRWVCSLQCTVWARKWITLNSMGLVSETTCLALCCTLNSLRKALLDQAKGGPYNPTSAFPQQLASGLWAEQEGTLPFHSCSSATSIQIYIPTGPKGKWVTLITTESSVLDEYDYEDAMHFIHSTDLPVLFVKMPLHCFYCPSWFQWQAWRAPSHSIVGHGKRH